MNLRPYQQKAHDSTMAALRRSVEPIVVSAATGSGKSHLVAALAKSLRAITPSKRVLVVAPSKELVIQDFGKYRATGNMASIYSASAGSKCLAHPVVFGTPVSVRNGLPHMTGGEWSAVVIDECHSTTATIKHIVNTLRDRNPLLRVVGYSATPYRLGTGWIYRHTAAGKALGDDSARDPYFARCVADVHARELIDAGFLTPPVIGATGDQYDTARLVLNKRHQFDAAAVDAAFVGHGRLTSKIIAEVVAKSKDRKGVLIFAATVAHAHECLASLPPHHSAIVTGKTPAKKRAELLDKFLSQEIKYLVNVSVLTTGFDAPHVDVIALLRHTESVGLLQQICGRGLRIADGKTDALILDYANNISTHCPDGDLFAPTIKAAKAPTDAEPIDATCPECCTVNEFSRVKALEDLPYDANGYCLDLAGNRIETEWGPLPAHSGRRCYGETHGERCDYRWSSRACRVCDAPNDISARHCRECGAELIDPNDKLEAEFKALKADPTRKQTDKLISLQERHFIARSGNPCVAVNVVTPYRQFTSYFQPESTNKWAAMAWRDFQRSKDGAKTITYRKSGEFWHVIAFDRPIDEIAQQN